MKTHSIKNIEVLIKTINSHPNNYIYRGQADAAWALESSLERIIGPTWDASLAMKLETHALSEFECRFHLYDAENTSPKSKLSWMAAMQHYGVPTRLIDFTTSPYVALYFAIESFRPTPSKQFALYAIDWSAVMQRSFQLLRDNVPGFSHTSDSHRNFQDEIFDKTVDPQCRDVVWVTEPKQLNKRLDRQSGCFVLSGNRAKRLMEILDSSDYKDVDFIKYEISESLYESVLSLLRKMNLNSKTLYGDLGGLGNWLRMELQVYARRT